MALSSRNLFAALAGALLLVGCATGPAPDAGEGADQSESGDQADGLSQAQKSAFERGGAALESGNADLAVNIFEDLIETDPELAPAHANLGTALMMRGDEALAISSFERAVALEPELVEAQVRLGVLYRRDGRFDKAEAAYQAALRADDEHRNAHLNLGILYDVYLQRPEQALKHYERFQALSAEPDEEVAIWIADLKQRL